MRSRTRFSFLYGVLMLAAWTASAQHTFTFDDITSLSEYDSHGVTFTANASLWFCGECASVTNDPDGGPYTPPGALQFGAAGGVLGSIFFAADLESVSLWALSGPSSDLLSSPMWIRAFDLAGTQIGEDNADPLLQFDLLSIATSGIRRLDVFSAYEESDVWDELTITYTTSSVAITTIRQEGDDIRLTWLTAANKTSYIQAASSAVIGNEGINFDDASPPILAPGVGVVFTNFLDLDAATNVCPRFYRIRQEP